MSARVVNHNQMRRMNRRVVLNLLRHKGSSSRVEIAQTLGCDGTTVTNIVRDLLALNIVHAVGADTTAGIGRPREIIELNANVKQAIGLSFDPRHIVGVVVNLQGETKIREQVFFDSDVSQKELLHIVDQLVTRLLDFCGRSKALGIGISTFGLLSPDEKIISLAAHFPALQGLDFGTHFLDAFGISPTVIDRTFAIGLAEIELKKRTVESPLDFLLLDIGMGIGCGIVRNGELLYGASGYVSEFGHMIFDMDGEICQCGHRGCLETLASVSAIEKGVSKALRGRAIGFEAIVERFIASDPAVVEVVDAAARWLGVGIANLVNLLTPTEIVLSGQLLDLRKPYLDVVYATVREFSLPPFLKNLRIGTSSLGYESAAMGATELLLKAFFDSLDTDEASNTVGED
jgi:N-acetylglucosamine repressor